MKKYEVKLLIKIEDSWWLDIEDFELEIAQFNNSNKRRIHARIIDYKELGKKE